MIKVNMSGRGPFVPVASFHAQSNAQIILKSFERAVYLLNPSCSEGPLLNILCFQRLHYICHTH